MSDEQQNILGKITPRSIVEEIQESYLDYAMSVIVSRALPDVRDGLKPVHRRILYAMHAMGLRPGAKFRKSAHVVGETMAKYHPHGDAAIYDAMVRMAQDFSMRYPLVWGQGNFGSMDGDAAAAHRYTEAKLAPISEELLSDIEKETVNFIPNYDSSHKEPSVFPARLPNLLLSGSMGIAVGMATNIPPHNLKEVCSAIIYLLDQPDCDIDDIMKYIPGPDFPTGGIIYNKADIKQAYTTGRGSIVARGRAEIVDVTKIIVTEIPYNVNKAELISRIADLVRDKKIEGIRDLRDESNKDGVRIVIDLKRDAYPKKVLNQLYDSTALQTSFHVNALALIDGLQPRLLNIKTILEEYIKHREEVVRKRTVYDLARAKERAHILEGLKIAIFNIDKVISIIKKSQDRDSAKINLIKNFKLTEIQSIAILEMRLQQLANLERLKVEIELKDKKVLIKELEAILASKKRIYEIIKNEVEELSKKFGDERRTEIVSHAVKEFRVEDLIPDENTIVMVTADGYIKRLPPETFKQQARGGKGIIGVTTKEEDIVEHLFSTSTHADLLFFTTRGRVFKLKAYEIPQAARTAKGQAVVNFLELAPGEKISAILPFKELGDYKYLVMATNKGLIKKVNLEDFDVVRRSGLIAIKLKPEDTLGWVKPSTGKDEIMIISTQGQSIRFAEKDVRSMGRVAAGVRGMKLKGKDQVVGMDILDPKLVDKDMMELFVLMKNGFGKRSNVKFYKLQHRGGSGVKTASVTEKTGGIVGAFIANAKDERDLIVISQKGQVIRTSFNSISVLGRATQGVRVMRFKESSDMVASVTFV